MLVTLVTYRTVGAAGFTVVAGGPDQGLGLAYMQGPTGGYLAGFALAATCVGWLAERGFDRSVATMFSVMILGTVLIYIPGILWLGTVIGWDKQVLQLGLFPFLYGDLLEVVLGAVLLPMIWKLLPGKTTND